MLEDIYPSSVVPFAYAFQAQTVIHIPGDAHPFQTSHVLVQVYSPAPNAELLMPGLIMIDPHTYDVRVEFLPYEYAVDSLATQPGDSLWWRWYSWVRHRPLLRRYWPVPRVWQREDPVPQSGTVVLVPMA